MESRFKAKAIDKEYHVNLEQQLDAFRRDWVKAGTIKIDDYTIKGSGPFQKLARLFTVSQKKQKRGKGSNLENLIYPVPSQQYEGFPLPLWRGVLMKHLRHNKFIDEITRGVPWKKCKYRRECRFHDMSGFSAKQMQVIRERYPFHANLKTGYAGADVGHFVCGLYSFKDDSDHKGGSLHIVATLPEMWKHLMMYSSHKGRKCYTDFVMLSIIHIYTNMEKHSEIFVNI